MGGAIYSTKTLKIYNCKFTNNKAVRYNSLNHQGNIRKYNNAYGGAIFSYGNLTVTNSQFTNNHPFNPGTKLDDVDCGGGAIYSGAIHWYTSDDDGDSIIINKANPIMGKNENTNLINCTFSQNSKPIFVIGDLTISGCKFNKNKGTLITSDGSKISNSKFTNNTGGTSKNYKSHLSSIGEGIIINSSFTNNKYYENGLSIYYANISNSNFTSNNAENGGALSISYGGIINNCIFKNNKATPNGWGNTGQGGAIYLFSNTN